MRPDTPSHQRYEDDKDGVEQLHGGRLRVGKHQRRCQHWPYRSQTVGSLR